MAKLVGIFLPMMSVRIEFADQIVGFPRNSTQFSHGIRIAGLFLPTLQHFMLPISLLFFVVVELCTFSWEIAHGKAKHNYAEKMCNALWKLQR